MCQPLCTLGEGSEPEADRADILRPAQVEGVGIIAVAIFGAEEGAASHRELGAPAQAEAVGRPPLGADRAEQIARIDQEVIAEVGAAVAGGGEQAQAARDCGDDEGRPATT
jgi:hypothetical protein